MPARQQQQTGPSPEGRRTRSRRRSLEFRRRRGDTGQSRDVAVHSKETTPSLSLDLRDASNQDLSVLLSEASVDFADAPLQRLPRAAFLPRQSSVSQRHGNMAGQTSESPTTSDGHLSRTPSNGSSSGGRLMSRSSSTGSNQSNNRSRPRGMSVRFATSSSCIASSASSASSLTAMEHETDPSDHHEHAHSGSRSLKKQLSSSTVSHHSNTDGPIPPISANGRDTYQHSALHCDLATAAKRLERRHFLLDLAYYHGLLGAEQASQLLLRPGVGTGTFLLHVDALWPASELSLLLSVCAGGVTVHHVPIDVDSFSGRCVIASNRFASIPDLVAEFRRRPLHWQSHIIGPLKGFIPRQPSSNPLRQPSYSDVSSLMPQSAATAV